MGKKRSLKKRRCDCFLCSASERFCFRVLAKPMQAFLWSLTPHLPPLCATRLSATGRISMSKWNGTVLAPCLIQIHILSLPLSSSRALSPIYESLINFLLIQKKNNKGRDHMVASVLSGCSLCPKPPLRWSVPHNAVKSQNRLQTDLVVELGSDAFCCVVLNKQPKSYERCV